MISDWVKCRVDICTDLKYLTGPVALAQASMRIRQAQPKTFGAALDLETFP